LFLSTVWNISNRRHHIKMLPN